ncbi:Dipeptidase [Lentilactobacillus parabuchneri]|nr:Dipeptidase [Lentilactobacillus parabuchneri]
MFSSKHSSCTTILVGKKASYDGSTLIARNEDAGDAVNPKKLFSIFDFDQII